MAAISCMEIGNSGISTWLGVAPPEYTRCVAF
jgi:hypothetical protein